MELKRLKVTAGAVRKGARSPRVIIPRIAGENLKVVEARLRRFCAGALRRAGRSLVFEAGAVSLGFPLRAVAKVLAQEIYRYARADVHRPGRLRDVRVEAAPRDAAAVRRTLLGYLEHIVTTLSDGPYVTVDVIISVKDRVVLIRRSNPPFGWALPGGFVDPGETLERAAAREAREETGLSVKRLAQWHTYSDPSRDPRLHTISTVFTARASGVPRASSDAADARLFSRAEWLRLDMAFDHKEILEEYFKGVKGE